jgi:hypothetical protein
LSSGLLVIPTCFGLHPGSLYAKYHVPQDQENFLLGSLGMGGSHSSLDFSWASHCHLRDTKLGNAVLSTHWDYLSPSSVSSSHYFLASP